MKKFNVTEDCPVFSGLFKYCQVSHLACCYHSMTAVGQVHSIGHCAAAYSPILMHYHAPDGCSSRVLHICICYFLCIDRVFFVLVQSYAGGSVGGAVKLNHGNADIVINWSGGLHHAKKAEVGCSPMPALLLCQRPAMDPPAAVAILSGWHISHKHTRLVFVFCFFF